MEENLVRRNVTYKEKVKILLKPFMTRKDIQIVLDSTFNEASILLKKILTYMKNKDYNIISLYKIPTKLFMDLSDISINDFLAKAEIEKRLNDGSS